MRKSIKPIRVMVEAVLLSLSDGKLQVALRRRERAPFARRWSLPRGRIRPDRDADSEAAMARVLRAKTGLDSAELHLEQLATHGDGERDPRGWSLSIVYIGLVSGVQNTTSMKSAWRWVALDALPKLAFDHGQLLESALQRVRAKSAYSSLPIALMPPQFTLRQLQTLYEQLLGGALDKRGFRRRIEELDVLEPVQGVLAGGVQRPAQMYRVRPSLRHQLVLADRVQRARADQGAGSE